MKTAIERYDKYLIVDHLDAETMKLVHDIFEKYSKDGILENNSFEDQVWILFNELSRTSLEFTVSPFLFSRNAMEWMECSFKAYSEAIKAYACLLLGKCSPLTIRGVISAAVKMGESGYEEAVAMVKYNTHLAELLRLLPGESFSRDSAIECLEETAGRYKRRHQRILADFSVYFQFHEHLETYWSNATEENRLFYFPIYLWWKLTAVLPLRPTEYLLIPRDCLRQSGTDNIITVRRTKLKGSSKEKSYRIDADYSRMEYAIPAFLAGQIRWYQHKTENMPPSPWGSLFRKGACCIPIKSNVFTCPERPYSYGILTRTLALFLQELEAVGMEVRKIRLGDTRHIAMMNLIISGGSPTICKELAGHADIDISSHYYSNMSGLVECATYEWYRKQRKGGTVQVFGNAGSQSASIPKKDPVPVENGVCLSDAWKQGNPSDCLMAVNNEGQFGDCLNCRYFLADNHESGFHFYDLQAGKASVDEDTWFLIHMIENVRKGIGLKEDLMTAVLRLQHSAFQYRDSLIRHLKEG